MCLTIPKKVVEIGKDKTAVVEKPDGSRQEIRSIIELKIGDLVLTQQNIAIEKISQENYAELLNLLKTSDE